MAGIWTQHEPDHSLTHVALPCPYAAVCVGHAGASSIIFQFCIAVGILTAQVVTYYTAPFEYGWRIALGAAGAPALLLVVATVALPESPQWLLMDSRIDEATVVLRKVYGVADVTIAVRGFALGCPGGGGVSVLTRCTMQGLPGWLVGGAPPYFWCWQPLPCQRPLGGC